MILGPQTDAVRERSAPVAMRSAPALIAVLEHGRGALVTRDEQLRQGILAIGSPLVTEVRGRGLAFGVGLTAPVVPLRVSEALYRGLIINAANAESIRFAPPLIIGDAESDRFMTLFPASMLAVGLEAATP